MTRRQTEGAETWRRLQNWDRGQAASERLAAHILRSEGYAAIDPSHPLGGPDGLKDVLCKRGDKKWIGAAYFPRGQQSFSDVRSKFNDDLQGVASNKAEGIAFVTNQELSLGQREQLMEVASPIECDLFHLERIESILNSPVCYGIRLEFLDIDMTKEEQLAFIASRDDMIAKLQATVESILTHLQKSNLLDSDEMLNKIPLAEIREFKRILDSVAGYEAYDPYSISIQSAWSLGAMKKDGHVSDLRVPLDDLQEFKRLLDEIVGEPDPVPSLSHWSVVTGDPFVLNAQEESKKPTIKDLHVPLGQLQEYESTLDRIIEKLKQKQRLES